jgi:hypothetical protein
MLIAACKPSWYSKLACSPNALFVALVALQLKTNQPVDSSYDEAQKRRKEAQEEESLKSIYEGMQKMYDDMKKKVTEQQRLERLQRIEKLEEKMQEYKDLIKYTTKESYTKEGPKESKKYPSRGSEEEEIYSSYKGKPKHDEYIKYKTPIKYDEEEKREEYTAPPKTDYAKKPKQVVNRDDEPVDKKYKSTVIYDDGEEEPHEPVQKPKTKSKAKKAPKKEYEAEGKEGEAPDDKSMEKVKESWDKFVDGDESKYKLEEQQQPQKPQQKKKKKKAPKATEDDDEEKQVLEEQKKGDAKKQKPKQYEAEEKKEEEDSYDEIKWGKKDADKKEDSDSYDEIKWGKKDADKKPDEKKADSDAKPDSKKSAKKKEYQWGEEWEEDKQPEKEKEKVIDDINDDRELFGGKKYAPDADSKSDDKYGGEQYKPAHKRPHRRRPRNTGYEFPHDDPADPAHVADPRCHADFSHFYDEGAYKFACLNIKGYQLRDGTAEMPKQIQ